MRPHRRCCASVLPLLLPHDHFCTARCRRRLDPRRMTHPPSTSLTIPPSILYRTSTAGWWALWQLAAWARLPPMVGARDPFRMHVAAALSCVHCPAFVLDAFQCLMHANCCSGQQSCKVPSILTVPLLRAMQAASRASMWCSRCCSTSGTRASRCSSPRTLTNSTKQWTRRQPACHSACWPFLF